MDTADPGEGMAEAGMGLHGLENGLETPPDG